MTEPFLQDEAAAPVDEKKLIDEVETKFRKMRDARRPHEITWFMNAAFERGVQYVNWNGTLAKLEVPEAPSYRVRLVVNRIRPKLQARAAKFLKNRFRPIVIAASTDKDDRLNARATQKVLDYLWRKLELERKYAEALSYAQICGKGFWWIFWNEGTTGRVKDPDTGQILEVPLGDVGVEVGSPFEVFVADSGISSIGEQPEIIRAKARDISDLEARYPQFKGKFKGESKNEAFTYERQIASLSARGIPGVGQSEFATGSDGEPTQVVVKELFTRPCGKYPKGRHVKVAGDILLSYVEELPFSPSDSNPFPVVEFADSRSPGQFWPTTLCEQLVAIQKEYNLVRSKLAEQLRLMAHPKILAPTQSKIPPSAYNSEPGEIIRYNAVAGLPRPEVLSPANIASDAWQTLRLIQEEFDDVSNIFPASQGQASGATSGFQTNLLQEATDSVHAPDIRLHEIAAEQAAFKIRHLVAVGYDIPRLISVTGKNYEPDVFEFHQNQVDEHADIVVYGGSALSTTPAVRTQQILELYKSTIFGDPNDPEVKRRTLGMLELSSMAEVEEIARRDEDLARLENSEVQMGKELPPPMPWENHDIHYSVHTDQLKSVEVRNWPPEARGALVQHLILHVKFINPAKAYELSVQLGFEGLVEPPPPPQAGGGPPGPPGQGPAAPPPGPPPPPPPPGV